MPVLCSPITVLSSSKLGVIQAVKMIDGNKWDCKQLEEKPSELVKGRSSVMTFLLL